ncbi:hypothetical protein [Maribacter sp. Asnod1-A12]|uniref:hypothetical protein n=1 Tax=Maribacter sp. Asnod1-A12 TaxID=3160576 RepID=UPI003869B2EC
MDYTLESSEASWKASPGCDGADNWLQTSDLQGDDAPFFKENSCTHHTCQFYS